MISNLSFIVTGATGWIGRNVCEYLGSKGFQIIACDLVEEIGPWNHFIQMDLTNDPITLSDLSFIQNSNNEWCLIHCAGYAHQPLETSIEKNRFYAVNYLGTKKITELCSKMNVGRIVYISSIAFYDWNQSNDTLNELSLLNAKTAYSDSKLKGEEVVINSNLDYRVVRLATVFGEGDVANFAKLAKAMKHGKFILPGSGDAQKSVISVKYAAEWICRFASLPKVPHRLINLGFAKAPTLLQICDSFTKCCGFRKVKQVPEHIIRLGALVGDGIVKFKSDFPFTSTNLTKLTTSTVADCELASNIFPEIKTLNFKDELIASSNYYKSI